MPNTISITVRVNNATRRGIDAAASSIGRITRAAADADHSVASFTSAAATLAPALLPVAASAAPLAASLAGAGAAMAAFGAAVIPQITHLSDAAKAQQKYTDAVAAHGARSKEALKAETAWLGEVQKLPPATREAAASFGALKDQFTDWSDSLAGDTMPVFTHSFEALRAIFPKFTPLVKDSSRELDRLVTIAAGGIESKSFDRFSDELDDFATRSLQHAITGMVHLARVMDSGEFGGSFREFMDYARQDGPEVAQTLEDLGQAAVHLLTAAADTGVSVLKLVDAFAKLVSAVPTSLISNMLQFYAAVKLVRLGLAGFGAAAAGMTAVSTQIVAMRTAAGAATGTMAGLRAGIAALSTTAKVGLATTGIGLLVVALGTLSNIGRKAPPDVNKLTTSMKRLGETGKLVGEAARVLGPDLKGLGDAMATLERPSNMEAFLQGWAEFIGMDSTGVKNAKEKVDALDDSLANLVKGGKTDLAAAALDKLIAKMKKSGEDTTGLRKRLDDYKSSLADMKLEQQLTADGMGLFGQKSLEVQEKLDAQKKSADGLRQSIQALNDAQRQGLGGMIGFEAAIDAAAKAAKENAGSLRMVHGELDLNSEKARNAAGALQDLADKTDEAAATTRESGGSWAKVNGIYARGRDKLVALAQQMGLTEGQAKKLADQILKTPNKTAFLRGDIQDLKDKIAQGEERLRTMKPTSKTAKLRGDIDDWRKKLAAAEWQLEHMKDKKTASIYAKDKTGRGVRSALANLRRVHGKHVYINVSSILSPQARRLAQEGYLATGGVVGGHAAEGGPRGSLTWVGEQGPELLRLPFGSTVRSNADSRAMVQSAGGGDRPLQLLIRSGGSRMDDLLVEILRRAIQAGGGNVQAVLGQKGRG